MHHRLLSNAALLGLDQPFCRQMHYVHRIGMSSLIWTDADGRYGPLYRVCDEDDLECVRTLLLQMVDVGCGIGGSSRHLSRKYSCKAQGITLSPVQVLLLTKIM